VVFIETISTCIRPIGFIASRCTMIEVVDLKFFWTLCGVISLLRFHVSIYEITYINLCSKIKKNISSCNVSYIFICSSGLSHETFCLKRFG
jgi:hypothetical protein